MEQGIETPLGRYRLIALLGQGGMADVYLACTKGPGGFQKMLVVKLARFSGEPMFSTMFLDEARIAAQLEHPNVVQTFEVGEEGSRHYIVMEYLDGANLSRLRNRAKKLGGIPLRTSIHILHQVLEGLAYAHEARGIEGKLLRVVHRDLTPSNIIITTQGVVKILDFGIAKAVDTQSFTQTGRYSGKLSYMPPEQLRVESVDGRADIFSVGVILAESVLGERFWGDATGEMIAQQLRAGQLPTLDNQPHLHPELRRILGRALAPDRDQRYPNASIFKADLLRFLNTLGGPLAREELGDFICEATADDRTKLKVTIDTQMQRISQLSLAQAPPPDLPILEMTPSDRSLHSSPTAIRREETKKDDSVVIERVEPIAEPVTTTADPKKRSVKARRSRLALAAGGAVFALGLGAGLSMMLRKTDNTPKAGIPAQPVTARLEVLVSPPDAVLKLDGKSLEMNPYAGSWPLDSQLHELVVTAAGFEPQTRHFTLERDLTLQLRLEPTKVAVPTPAPTPVATKPAVVEPPHVKVATQPHAVAAKARPVVQRPQPAHVTTPPAPPTAVVAAPAPAPAPTPAVTTSNKRTIDGDVFDKKTTKRTIDSDVFDGSNAKKPTLDRDNPWKK
jgi:eukaryotic-like serine/threonine-protein kinase